MNNNAAIVNGYSYEMDMEDNIMVSGVVLYKTYKIKYKTIDIDKLFHRTDDDNSDDRYSINNIFYLDSLDTIINMSKSSNKETVNGIDKIGYMDWVFNDHMMNDLVHVYGDNKNHIIYTI